MSERAPRVSVVIPAWNRAGQLELCLDELARQTLEDFEVVVVDDGSTDGTTEMLARFRARHPAVELRVERNERRSGANTSRNRGIAAARGELVAFLDSDAWPRADWLEHLVAGFDRPTVAAVTGTVIDDPPRNVWDLALLGAHRVDFARRAPRLVAGNMCLRRALLLEYPLDTDLLYGCDEEGIFLRLRAAGHALRVAPDAVVVHDHHYDRAAFFRQASVGGKAAAWLVYKYHLPPRLDLLPFLLAWACLPLAFLGGPWIAPCVLFAATGVAALAYNDLARKRKTLGQTLRTLPALLLFYQARLFAYVGESLRLRLTRHSVQRVRL